MTPQEAAEEEARIYGALCPEWSWLRRNTKRQVDRDAQEARARELLKDERGAA